MRLVRPSKKERDALTTSSHTDQPWMEIENTSWRLQKLETTIYDLSFIRPTQRPFATWELTLTPEPVALADLPDKGAEQDTHEVVISETRFAQSGKLRGRLLVRYSKDALTRGEDGSWKAEGRILKQGKPCRHFQVHEAMLGEEWQVLD
ncbi:hypothetical protein CBOM_04659 [Ceraceosorus bombacis]|uniref:Uncharacterized protein n=1 Tax=Ceraceosorus bombacis TaxID=401625 RepID=A0A0P1BNX5_9BASI|nr:hypothetical protein CBOM_04659 [Ceraceosorus bombacis]